MRGGGEKYFIIGNFNDDSNTLLDSNSNTNMFYGGAYFYIDDVSVVDCTVGINEIESYKNKISLMPNPARNQTIHTIVLNKNETGTIEIFTGLGIKVNSYNISTGSNVTTIDLSNLNQGIYLIKTIVNNKVSDIRKLAVIK